MRKPITISIFTALLLTGCSGAIHPFVDDSTPPSEMTTPSERALRDANVPSAVRLRGWPAQHIKPVAGDVTHWPTWFEDPFEDKGSADGRFAWTAEDYFAYLYSFPRWFLNSVALPVSMAVTPPFTPMVSDGKLSRQILGHDHDAARISEVGSNADDTFAESPEP